MAKYGDADRFQRKTSSDCVKLRGGAMSLFIEAEEEVHGRT